MLLKTFRTKITYTVLATLFLIGTTELWQSRETDRVQKEQQALFERLLPGSTSFAAEETEEENAAIRQAFRGENGYIVESVTAGFGGDIVLLVGVDENGIVTGVEVKELHETQGYGSKAKTDPSFAAQFTGTAGDAEIGKNVDAISGATGTSKAVAQGVNAAVAYVTGAEIESEGAQEIPQADIASGATQEITEKVTEADIVSGATK